MAGRFDCLLCFPAEGFLAEVVGQDLCEPAELHRGIEAVVEQEEKEEVLGFLKMFIVMERGWFSFGFFLPASCRVTP